MIIKCSKCKKEFEVKETFKGNKITTPKGIVYVIFTKCNACGSINHIKDQFIPSGV